MNNHIEESSKILWYVIMYVVSEILWYVIMYVVLRGDTTD